METQAEEPQVQYTPEDHPWLEIAGNDLDEALRYSLDEIRIA